MTLLLLDETIAAAVAAAVTEKASRALTAEPISGDRFSPSLNTNPSCTMPPISRARLITSDLSEPIEPLEDGGDPTMKVRSTSPPVPAKTAAGNSMSTLAVVVLLPLLFWVDDDDLPGLTCIEEFEPDLFIECLPRLRANWDCNSIVRTSS